MKDYSPLRSIGHKSPFSNNYESAERQNNKVENFLSELNKENKVYLPLREKINLNNSSFQSSKLLYSNAY